MKLVYWNMSQEVMYSRLESSWAEAFIRDLVVNICLFSLLLWLLLFRLLKLFSCSCKTENQIYFSISYYLSCNTPFLKLYFFTLLKPNCRMTKMLCDSKWLHVCPIIVLEFYLIFCLEQWFLFTSQSGFW